MITHRIMKSVALYLISLVFVGLRLINASESIEGIDTTRMVSTESLKKQQDYDISVDTIICESADRQLVVNVVFDLISDNIEDIKKGVRNIRNVSDYDLFFAIIKYNINWERASMIPFCTVVAEAHKEVYDWFVKCFKSYITSSFQSFCEEYQISSGYFDLDNDPVDLIRLKMIHYCRLQLYNILLEYSNPDEWNYYIKHKIAMYQGLMDKAKNEEAAASYPEDLARAVYQLLFNSIKRIEEFEYEASREKEEEFERLSMIVFAVNASVSDNEIESFKTAIENGDNEDSASEFESDTQPRETVQEIVSEFVNRIRNAAIDSIYELISEESSEAQVPLHVFNEAYDEAVSLSDSVNEDENESEHQTEESVQSKQTEDESVYRIQHNNTPTSLTINGSDDESITISVQDSEYSDIEDGASVDAFDNLVVIPGVTESNDNTNENDPLVEDRNESVTDEADNVDWANTLSNAEIATTEPTAVNNMDVTEDVQVETQEQNNEAVPVDTIVSMEEDNAHDEESADSMEIESQASEGEERIEANIVIDNPVNHHTTVPSDNVLQSDDHSENDSVAPSVTYNLIENDQVDHPVNNSLIELIQERGIVEIRNDPEERDSDSEVEERKSESFSDEEVELVEDSNRSDHSDIMNLHEFFTLSKVPEKNEVNDADSDDSSSDSSRSSDSSSESSSKSSLYDEKGTMRALRRAEKCKNIVTVIVRPLVRKDSSSDSESSSDSDSNSSSSSESSTSSITSTSSIDPINVPVVMSQQSVKPTSTTSSFNIRNIVIVVVAAVLIASVIGLGWMMYQRIDLEEEEKQ